ncbi:uncharacterized protein LOC127749357 [Frankliniella occidentalis]|uniref:Uncharacterized protein LOC127749357 n=1 Tax=Frankliniella occidentalis TaxID=133901 RepID=A0A9C6U537_FRAOC|nr:uncharacterized protein LOC127749357 [Frankliniella occidentalis]
MPEGVSERPSVVNKERRPESAARRGGGSSSRRLRRASGGQGRRRLRLGAHDNVSLMVVGSSSKDPARSRPPPLHRIPNELSRKVRAIKPSQWNGRSDTSTRPPSTGSAALTAPQCRGASDAMDRTRAAARHLSVHWENLLALLKRLLYLSECDDLSVKPI